MDKSLLIKELISLLEQNKKDSEVVKETVVLKSLCVLNWILVEPYGDWNYYHCMTELGGVFPFSLPGLIYHLQKSNK